MHKNTVFIISTFIFLSCINYVNAQKRGKNIDSILNKMYIQANYYEKNTPNFEAEMDIRGTLDVKKQNIILKAIPFLRKIDKNTKQYFIELSSTLSYTQPNIYNQNFKSISTNSNDILDYMESTILPYVKGNVYSFYLYEHYYSPIARKAKKYYKYTIDSQWTQDSITYYKISFTPKIKNYQLLSGDMIINANNWSFRSLFIKGRAELLKFSSYIEMGDIGSNSEFLIKSYNITSEFHLLGNKLSGNYSSSVVYKKTTPPEPEESKRKGKYDLSLLYNAHFSHDPPDTAQTNVITPDTTRVKKNTFLHVGKFFISNYSIDMADYGRLQFSPIISPVLFNYSSSDGISYAQKLKYNKLFKGDRLLYIEPKIGYNFKYQEFYWYVRSILDYAPKRNSSILFDIGSGNKISTDRILADLNTLPQSIFDRTKLNLTDFKNSYVHFGHKIEVANGFSVSAILSLQKYAEIKKSDFTFITQGVSPNLYKKALTIARHSYTSFVPELQLDWTPHQYYYMNGNRKVALYSKYPTFSLNWAYAIKGILNSTTTYHRIEFDMQHKIKLGLMETLCYRFGIGGFINYTDLYFADFKNFQRNNLPVGWDDEIGGTFQLLSSFKYNEIDKYIRGHIKYDAPFLLVPTVFRWVPYVMKERLYCNLLFVKTLKPYIEFGYGIGTNLFNVGAFIGGEINKFNLIGFKFTLEIFNN
ncbi:MAG: DUF5686 family protein [Bacteroidales bacterium]